MWRAIKTIGKVNEEGKNKSDCQSIAEFNMGAVQIQKIRFQQHVDVFHEKILYVV